MMASTMANPVFADDVVNLKIHLIHFVHMLHMHASHFNQAFAMAHQRTNFTNRLFRSKRLFQTDRMQILKPLTVQHVGLASGP